MLGSTSEVAKAICRELASRGCGRFHLLARNEQANQDFAKELEQCYAAAVSTEQIDLLANSDLELARRPEVGDFDLYLICLLYTSPSPRDLSTSRMPSSA